MKIEKINSIHNRLKSNSYLVYNDKDEGILIDAGVELADVKKFNINIKAILLTHCHFDHIMFLNELQKYYSCQIYISIMDKLGLLNQDINLSKAFHKTLDFSEIKNNIITFNDNEILNIADISIKCILTPGHTAGSACFLIGKYLFSGDTLFAQSIGRTDLPTSSYLQQKSSLKRLANFDYNILYPGHDRISNKEEQIKNIKFWLSIN